MFVCAVLVSHYEGGNVGGRAWQPAEELPDILRGIGKNSPSHPLQTIDKHGRGSSGNELLFDLLCVRPMTSVMTSPGSTPSSHDNGTATSLSRLHRWHHLCS